MVKADKYMNQKINHFGIKYRLGQGAFATIYAAEDLEKSTPSRKVMVALKVPLNKDENYKKNMREAEMLLGLDHPNIVRCYSIEMDRRESIFFFVMEIAQGKDLDEIITLAGGPLSNREVEHFGRQLLDSCRYLERNYIVHRDMKPANVVVVDNSPGLLKIMDFGLAINLLEWDHKGKRAGSLLYMAPEQCTGEPIYASDVWGVGAIMYRMLTGKPPFMGHTEDELMEKINSSEPTNITELNPKADPKLVELIMRCLEKDPSKRYHYEDMPEPYRVRE